MSLELAIAFGIFFSSVFVSSCSQILLKKSAGRTYASRLREYLNPSVIIAYVLFFASTLGNVFALRYVPLSLSPALEASGYVFVGLLSYFFLRERLSRQGVIGYLLIVIGITVTTFGVLD